MQLVAVPVSHVPDLNFVYGVLKLYDGETELSYPMQGLHDIVMHSVVMAIKLSPPLISTLFLMMHL